MTRSARRDRKYPAMFLLRRRRAPIPLQDLPGADGNEESEASKGKSLSQAVGSPRIRSAIRGNGGEKQRQGYGPAHILRLTGSFSSESGLPL